ncbi:MAG: hypothetical protein JWQ03_3108 [Variovorax sp.]|nr:hypothetical protein [Variovorax sp.]
MITPGTLNLRAGRHVPFTYTMDFVGIDLTGADLQAQVRLKPDTPGSPLIDLPDGVLSGATGLRFLSVSTTDGIPTSIVTMFITEADMEDGAKVPSAVEPGDDVTLSWDMQITPSGGVKSVYLRGAFIVEGGVTQ